MVNFELFDFGGMGGRKKNPQQQQQQRKTQNQQQTRKNTENFVSSVSVCANCLLSIHWTPLRSQTNSSLLLPIRYLYTLIRPFSSAPVLLNATKSWLVQPSLVCLML